MQATTWGVLLALSAAAVGASGCQKPEFGGVSDRHGRYAGVGIYTPNSAWARMLRDAPTASTSTAKLADDEAIIVVTDSQTGEIRACGDLSGYCVGMNPWRSGLAKSQLAPVILTQHANAQATGQTNSVAGQTKDAGG